MIKSIFIFFILFFIGGSANAYVYSNDLYNSADIQNLNMAEYLVFGKNNLNFSPQERLERTEQSLFGSVQPGTFRDRVRFINKVVKNDIQTRNAININKRRKLNRLYNAVNDLFNGTVTGFTPPVYYNGFTNTSFNNRVNSFNDPYYFHKTNIPQPYGNGIGNFVTQTRVIIDNN